MDPNALMSEVTAKLGPGGLSRVETCLNVLAGRSRPDYGHDEQEATRLFFPGISAQPWHDPTEFAWVADVEAAFPAIRDEFLTLRDENAPFAPYEDGYTKELGWAGWDTFALYKQGVWRQIAQERCPKTVTALGRTPHGPRDGMFTVLNPGVELTPHTGGVNLLLTCHLALVVPPGCGIEVAGDIRTWQEGRVLIFDDSFIHSAWNRGDSWRSVLLWDIWHPDLSAREINALEILLPLLADYLSEA